MSLSSTGALTIDVDALRCYRDIHGLPPRDDEEDPIFTHALPRFLALLDELGAKGTLFVVGRDLKAPAHAKAIEDAARAGHEIASHSYEHDYRLSKLPAVRIALDLEAADDAIERVTGKRPAGFRAPGYNQSEALMDALDERGYAYDSSFFPTPAYFAARALAIGLYKARRRSTRSLVGDVREFSSQRTPFVPAVGARFRPAKSGEKSRSFVELPMGTAARLPWLGTTLALASDLVGEGLTRAALSNDDVPAILELHAIDFLSDEDGVEPALVGAQADLKVPLADKLRRLRRAMALVVERREVLPLVELASRAQASREGSPS